MKVALFQQIARQIDRRLRLINLDVVPEKWITDCEEKLEKLETLLPSGSGIDSGTKINLEDSKPNMIILDSSYHVMADGYYTHWIDFEVIVLPSLSFPFMLDIDAAWDDGNDDIQDHLYQTYEMNLSEELEAI